MYDKIRNLNVGGRQGVYEARTRAGPRDDMTNQRVGGKLS